MKNAVDHLDACPVLQGLPGIIDILSQCRSLEKHIDKNNSVLDNLNSAMSPYNLSETEKQLARFGDRVSIIVGLELGSKITEKDAFEQIKAMYKELKSTYKAKKEV